jgi:Prp8 binding protein
VASADCTAQAWDVEASRKVGKLAGHSLYVNGVCAWSEHGAATSSDDGTVRLWDLREQDPNALTFDIVREATSVAWSPRNSLVFAGSLDNLIRGFDPRLGAAAEPVMLLQGHADTVTGLSVSPDGKRLLSHALDGSLRVWDVAPFSALADRCLLQVAHGQPAAAASSLEPPGLMRCAWSPDGARFSAGSGLYSKHAVCVWDHSGRPLLALPGHAGQVIEAAFHPTENVLASCGMDGNVLVGEL